MCHLQAEGFLSTASLSNASAARAASSLVISWPNPGLLLEWVEWVGGLVERVREGVNRVIGCVGC